MAPLARNRRIRKRRGSCWTTESSRRANACRWRIDNEQRQAGEAERVRELAEMEVENLPRAEGDALGCLAWTDFRTGRVRRWVVRIGARVDQVTVEDGAGRRTGSHGWTWVLDHLRGFLAGRKG